MNTIKDTISTLEMKARVLVELVLQHARKLFDENGHVGHVLFAVKENEDDVHIHELEHFDDQVRAEVHKGLEQIRECCPVCGFLAEVWSLHRDSGEEAAADLEEGTRPSESPNRKELLMFTIWQRDRHVIFAAPITRQPNKLGEFKVFFDSYFPPKVDGDAIRIAGGLAGKVRYNRGNN